MNKLIWFFSSFVLGSVLLFTACEKNTDSVESVTTKTVNDESIIEDYWTSIDSDVDFVSDLMEFTNFKSVTDSCPTIIVEHPDSLFFPRTVTIDFGDTYCETWHGRLKKGKIVITLSDRMGVPGSVRTVTLDQFYINDYHIEGTNTLTNNGFNDSGNMNWNVILTGGKITTPDGAEITRTMRHNREWTVGIDTPRYWWDNEWLIRGTATGTNRDGVVYSNEISNPVLVKAVCRFPVSGTVDMQIADVGTYVLDYGRGECDNIATVTFGDRIWEITLGRQ